jgi:HSP20 family molecular chaperone IbpA
MEAPDDEVRRLLDELEGVAVEATPDGVVIHEGDATPTGREKFSRRRKLRRLRRLLSQAARTGDLADVVESRAPAMTVREAGDRATVVVDAADVTVELDGAAVVVRAGGAERRLDLSFAPTEQSRTVSNGITTVELA